MASEYTVVTGHQSKSKRSCLERKTPKAFQKAIQKLTVDFSTYIWVFKMKLSYNEGTTPSLDTTC